MAALQPGAALAQQKPAQPRAGVALVVAAASDLQFALPEIAAAYTADGNPPVRLVFGSSGNLARQIRQGAPFDLFLSADETYALALADDGLTEGQGIRYARGALVLALPPGSRIPAGAAPADAQPDDAAPATGLEGLARALAEGRLRRFAIANPEHAPYGRAAREALISAGLWEALQGHLVLGENVSQAAQFALSGQTDGGLIARSLSHAPALAARGRFVPVDPALHAPLNQRAVVLGQKRRAAPQEAAAQRFLAFLQGDQAREILRRNGFALPEPEGN